MIIILMILYTVSANRNPGMCLQMCVPEQIPRSAEQRPCQRIEFWIDPFCVARCLEDNFFQPHEKVRLLAGKRYDQRLLKINSLPNWKYRELFDFGTCAGRPQTINRQPQFNRFSRNREFPSECREVEFHNDENVILACPYTNRNSNRDCVDGVSIMYSTIKTCDITF